jgi:PAS domain S-box-containing protein
MTQIEPEERQFLQKSNSNFFVVGIGASAGGLRALEDFFDSMRPDSGAAFVVIQHLSPDFKSLMKELLERHTNMTVYRVDEGMELQANCIYLIPPGKNLRLKKNILHLETIQRHQEREINFPIDIFFQSLAKNYRDRAIGIVLSGSGSDGTRGLSSINEAGGISLVQEPSTAEFDGMPRSAIATGLVNRVLPVKELAELIYQCVTSSSEHQNLYVKSDFYINHSAIEKIIELLSAQTDLDFSLYKISTISRRIHRRLLINNAKQIEEYLELLSNSAEERKILSSDLLINVTRFFRDPLVWKVLAESFLKDLIEQSQPEEELRFWVTACATGEEAYSLAILLDELLENSSKNIRFKIFGTDIDRTALDKASQGIYPETIVNEVSPARLQKYFIRQDNSYQIVRRLREMLIFAVHDLGKDAGFTRIHLITCRNVLIYMQPQLQDRVLRNLHFSLGARGILLLGEAETLGDFENEFQVLDRHGKIFQKLRDVRLTLPVKDLKKFPSNNLNYTAKIKSKSPIEPLLEKSLSLLLAEEEAIVLIVDLQQQLLHVCGDGSKIFKTPDGKVTTDVLKMVVQPLQLPLTTALHRAKRERKSVLFAGIKLESAEDNFRLKVIYNTDFFLVKIEREQPLSISLSQTEPLEITNPQENIILELERELTQTQENLQTLIEELESTNEEQQASNEELIASNEELQSTNEELHSVNEELHTVNIEYQSKIQQLIEVNNDIDNLLRSTNIGVIFLDRELKIRKFTPAIKEIVQIRDTDIDRPLRELAHNLDCPNLIQLLEGAIADRQPLELEVKLTNSHRYFLLRVTLYQIQNHKFDGIVLSAIALDEIKKVQEQLETEIKERKQIEANLRQSETRFRAIFNSTFQFTWLLEPNGILLEANQTALNFNQLQRQDAIGRPFWETKWWSISLSTQQKLQQAILTAALGQFVRYEVEILDPENNLATIDFSLNPIRDETTKVISIVSEGRVITELKQAREELRQLNQELEIRVQQRTQTLADFSNHLKQLHRISTNSYQNLEDLFADYLQTGCSIFNLEIGTIGQITESKYEIIAVKSEFDFPVVNQTNCQNLYCEELLESRKTVIYGNLANLETIKSHPIYKNIELEFLISTPIFIETEIYGTLTFCSPHSRAQEFASYEIEIIELMARGIGQAIHTHQTERELQESEVRFRSTFEQAAVGVAHLAPDGQFIRLNQRFAEIVGYSHEQLINLSFQDITHPEDLEVNLEYFKEIFIGDKKNFSLETRYIRGDRSSLWIDLTVSLVKEATGKAKYFIAVIEDISDRKQMDLVLKQANQAKDAFIAHMNHELRTPLNAILGFAKIIEQDPTLTEQTFQNIKLVHQSGLHLLTLINDILNLSKIEAGKIQLQLQDFHFISFLDNLGATLRLRAQTKGIAFYNRFHPSLPPVIRADETRLRQVLFNLLSNALTFTQIGKISFQVEHLCQLDRESKLHKIRFKIKDTGIGIPEDKLNQIFLPFEQLDRTQRETEGTGLGLTIAKSLLELMNSQLQVKSILGEGSVFWFDVDVLEGDPTGIPIPELDLGVATKVIDGRGRKILVVDDVSDNRQLLVEWLEFLSFEVVTAENGVKGLEVAKSFQPHAILLDILMPEMDGIEVLARIRKDPQLKNIVVILISADLHFEESLRNRKVKFEDFLSKPVDLDLLIDSLKTHLKLESIQSEFKTDKNLSSFILPSQEEILSILQLAQIGDMDLVIEKTNSLEKIDNNYLSFVREVQKLASSFQQYKLISFLEELANY